MFTSSGVTVLSVWGPDFKGKRIKCYAGKPICTSSKYVHKKEQMKISPAYSLTWYSTINCFDGAFVTSLSFLMDEHIPSVKTRKKVIGHSTNIPVLNESVCVC